MQPPDEKPRVEIHIHNSTIGAVAGGAGAQASSRTEGAHAPSHPPARAFRRVPLYAAIVIVAVALAATVAVLRDERQKSRATAPLRRPQVARPESVPTRTTAEESPASQDNGAKDAEERALSPEDRTSRILEMLPDVCEAKRLLARAPEPEAASLQKARSAIAVAEAKQLTAERKAFSAKRAVVCNDGWTSTCSCSHMGSGCCSNHGGVAGCEPLPKEILCPAAK